MDQQRNLGAYPSRGKAIEAAFAATIVAAAVLLTSLALVVPRLFGDQQDPSNTSYQQIVEAEELSIE